jgi:hypothetical protein
MGEAQLLFVNKKKQKTSLILANGAGNPGVEVKKSFLHRFFLKKAVACFS